MPISWRTRGLTVGAEFNQQKPQHQRAGSSKLIAGELIVRRAIVAPLAPRKVRTPKDRVPPNRRVSSAVGGGQRKASQKTYRPELVEG